MRRLLLIILACLAMVAVNAQKHEYLKDQRKPIEKEDKHNNYQAEEISKTTLLKALELAGVQIFELPISPSFEKEYSLSIMLHEYEGQKLLSSKDILPSTTGKNTYMHFIKDSIGGYKTYADYIPAITIFAVEKDSTITLSTETYVGTRRAVLKKKKQREGQFYLVRKYSKMNWKLNTEVPLLVFASSWYDENIQSDRFCGTAVLTENEPKTKELLDNSPHYYVVTIKVSDQ